MVGIRISSTRATDVLDRAARQADVRSFTARIERPTCTRKAQRTPSIADRPLELVVHGFGDATNVLVGGGASSPRPQPQHEVSHPQRGEAQDGHPSTDKGSRKDTEPE